MSLQVILVEYLIDGFFCAWRFPWPYYVMPVLVGPWQLLGLHCMSDMEGNIPVAAYCGRRMHVGVSCWGCSSIFLWVNKVAAL